MSVLRSPTTPWRTATSYTVTGASGGHQLVLETWTVTLVGGDFVGTITATPGNVLTGTVSLTSGSAIVTGSGTAFLTQCVIGVPYNFGTNSYIVASIQSNTQLTLLTAATANANGVTITSGQAAIYAPGICTFSGNGTLSKTFTFTPYSADTVIFSFTNSGSLSNVADMTFLATRMYYLDQFTGASGTSISGWDSNALPGVSGSPYTVTGSIELDGNGMTFMSSGSSAGPITSHVAILQSGNIDTGVSLRHRASVEHRVLWRHRDDVQHWQHDDDSTFVFWDSRIFCLL